MILLVGAGGMLGKSIIASLSARSWNFAYVDHHSLDITNEIGVRKAISKFSPTVVINCAAATNVDWCEQNEPQANLVNGDGPRFLASASKRYGAKFIQISTDYVFDGAKATAYTEQDPVSPLQAYGRSKLLGEQYSVEEDGIVLRVQWLFGSGKINFVDRILQAAAQSSEISISTDQKGSLCSTEWLAYLVILSAMQLQKPGIYNLSHDDSATRFECAEYILQRIGADTSILHGVDGGNFGIAKRPINTVMDCSKIRAALKMKDLSSWKRDVDVYIEQRYRI